MTLDVFVLGGHQTDFARNWSKEGKTLTDLVTETVAPTLEDAGLTADGIDTVHVGNLAGELFAGQAQLGGIVIAADRGLEGKPSARHEAACASGSIAISAAVAEIAAGLRQSALASREIADQWARSRGVSLADLPRISGFGHTSSTLLLDDKLARAPKDGVMFPHLRSAVSTALESAGVQGIQAVDVAEVHDCFTISGLLAVEHLGLTGPGKGARAILDGETMRGGRLPINPGGGLMAAGHPVGATGVRMVLDASRQVSGSAGAQQIDGARTALTVNIGGSFTTVVSFVVQAGK